MSDPSVPHWTEDSLSDNRGQAYRIADFPKLPLDGCHAKLDRARDHFQKLDRELTDFFDSNPYRAFGEVEDDTDWYVFRLEPPREPPPRVGVVLGDFIHQLRSTLDHLVFEVATDHLGRQPPNTISFPITASESNYPRQAFAKLTDARRGEWVLPSNALALIEGYQPYHAGDAADEEPLLILERLWNLDKHQTVIPVAVSEKVTAGTGGFVPIQDVAATGEMRGYPGIALKAGAKVTRVRIERTGPDPKVRMNSSTQVRVASGKIQSLMPTLWEALLAVQVLVIAFSASPRLVLPMPSAGLYLTTIIGE